jgi:hypothetical protein
MSVFEKGKQSKTIDLNKSLQKSSKGKFIRPFHYTGHLTYTDYRAYDGKEWRGPPFAEETRVY